MALKVISQVLFASIHNLSIASRSNLISEIQKWGFEDLKKKVAQTHI